MRHCCGMILTTGLFCRMRHGGSAKDVCLTGFVLIHDYLKVVTSDSDAELSIELKSSFIGTVRRYAKMFGEIDEVTISLQIRGQSLSACKEDVLKFIEAVFVQMNMQGVQFYPYKIGTECIVDNDGMTTSPIFESGAVKIQEGKEYELSRNQRRILSPLLMYPINSDGANEVI